MPSLHLIKDPIDQQQLEQLLAIIATTDAILLMQDACYSVKNSHIEAQLYQLSNTCYILHDDLVARNISCSSLQQITYQQFVALTLQFQNTISW